MGLRKSGDEHLSWGHGRLGDLRIRCEAHRPVIETQVACDKCPVVAMQAVYGGVASCLYSLARVQGYAPFWFGFRV